MLLENLMFSLNVVLPLFLCCVIGQVCRRIHLVSEAFVSDCSKVVFYLAIPSNIFLSISGSDLSRDFSPRLLLFLVTVILGLCALLVLVVPRVIRSRPDAATVSICLLRGNFAMLGIPLAQSLMGPEGALPTMVMIPFGTLLFTVLTVAILVLLGQEHAGSRWAALGKTTRDIIKNPTILASVASILVAIFHIPLPEFAETTIGHFAHMCTGLALFMLGAQLNMQEVKGRLHLSLPVIFIRLVVIPAVMLTLAALLGFRGGEMACIFIFFAAPTAVNCYILAGRMGGNGKLAGDVVLMSSCASSLSLVLGIFILKTLALL